MSLILINVNAQKVITIFQRNDGKSERNNAVNRGQLGRKDFPWNQWLYRALAACQFPKNLNTGSSSLRFLDNFENPETASSLLTGLGYSSRRWFTTTFRKISSLDKQCDEKVGQALRARNLLTKGGRERVCVFGICSTQPFVPLHVCPCICQRDPNQVSRK